MSIRGREKRAGHPGWTRHPQLTPQMLLLRKGPLDPQRGHITLLSVQHRHGLGIYHRCSSLPCVMPLPLGTPKPRGGRVSVGSPFVVAQRCSVLVGSVAGRHVLCHVCLGCNWGVLPGAGGDPESCSPP